MINFPGLNLQFNIKPIAFEIFKIPIYWYGILMTLAFLIAMIIIYKKCEKVGIKKEVIEDYFIILIPATLIGARLYYILFNLEYYKNNINQILNVREGGLAIYGGIISGIITTIIFSKIKGINFLKLTDLCVPYLALGQSIGRWGNFINQEAYGKETNLPWRMEIYSKYYDKIVAVHPTFLYESIWNFLLFLILIKSSKSTSKKEGIITILYIMIYAIGRFLIESLRIDSLMLGSFKISQIVSLVLVLICIICIIYVKMSNEKLK